VIQNTNTQGTEYFERNKELVAIIEKKGDEVDAANKLLKGADFING